LLQEGLQNGLQNVSVETYRRCADRGSAAAAYMAGIQYKNRILGQINRHTPFVSDARTNDSRESRGVLDTNELAFKYLEQAAEADIGLAMQSLSTLYEEGQGCRKSWGLAREWLWRAVLKDSAGEPQAFSAARFYSGTK